MNEWNFLGCDPRRDRLRGTVSSVPRVHGRGVDQGEIRRGLPKTCAEIATETGLIDLLKIGKGISCREAMPSSLAAAVYESWWLRCIWMVVLKW